MAAEGGALGVDLSVEAIGRARELAQAGGIRNATFVMRRSNPRPRQDSNLCFRLRRPTLYPLSYGGDPNPSLATGFLGPVAGQRSSASILRSWSPKSHACCWSTTTP